MAKMNHGILQIKKNINSRTLMFFGIFILLNVLCLFQLVKFSAGSLLITGMILLIGVLIKYEELGIYLFICLAFFNVMNARVQTTSLFYVLCGIIVARYLLQEHKKYRLSHKIVLLCGIFLVTAYNLTDTIRYLSWFILLFTCILLYHERIITDKIAEIITLYSLAVLLASWWGYLMLNSGMAINNGAEMFFSGHYSYLRFAGLVGDSVFFGALLLVLISANMVLLLANSQKPWLRLFLIVNMAILGSLTYSKTFYGGLIIELILFFWFWLNRKKGNVKAFIMTVIAIIIVFAGLSLWIGTGTGNTATIMRQRMSVSDLSTGRLVAWAYYINLWLHDWTIIFKGIGFAEYAARRTFAGYTHSVMYAHNILIESITAFGLLETVAVLLGMWGALRRFLRQRANLFWLLPAFMLFVVFGMISHGNFESSYYFSVLLVVTIPGADARKILMDGKETLQ